MDQSQVVIFGCALKILILPLTKYQMLFVAMVVFFLLPSLKDLPSPSLFARLIVVTLPTYIFTKIPNNSAKSYPSDSQSPS